MNNKICIGQSGKVTVFNLYSHLWSCIHLPNVLSKGLEKVKNKCSI